eukprot:scaffold3618_cov129-Cylindrotheca_fusiformis.AAC.2
MDQTRQISLALLCVVGFSMVLSCDSFAPVISMTQSPPIQDATLQVGTVSPFSTIDVAAGTLDPTTFLSDLFAGLLGTPAILAVPIVAALGVASLIAFLIVSYANPQVEDDEY